MDMGFTSLYSKMKLPRPLMTLVGHVCDFISWGIGRKLRVNSFTVSVSYNAIHLDIYVMGGTGYNEFAERKVDGDCTQITFARTWLFARRC